jgi:uncharacterized protein (TIGR02271 family)
METSTRNRTVVGVFDDYPTAQGAADKLIAAGFSRDEVAINAPMQYAEESARGNTGLTGEPPSDKSGGGIGGFFRRIFGGDFDEHDHGTFAEAVRRGGAVVCVTTGEADQDLAADVMNDNGAVDIDRRAASWRQRGYTGYDASAPPYSEEEIARERQHYGTEKGDRTIPVVKEELRIGKRAVQRGGVRVYNRVRQEPVEQQVDLREEHVRVDRRKADRPATEADIRKRDEVVEVTEMAEEPVLEKRTRVVEEVVVAKEATKRTETIRDSLRQDDVTVERLTGDDHTEYDDDFKTDFKKRFGSVPSAKYETYAPAYRYGYRMASDERYRGRNWQDVESTLRTDYERRYPNNKWEQMKDAVRYGWEKITGRH